MGTKLDEIEQLRIDDKRYLRFRIRPAQFAQKCADQNQIAEPVLPDNKNILRMARQTRFVGCR